MNALPQLILGSGSPRRKELLALFGQPFSVQAVDVDESAHAGEEPAAYVQRLAEAKAAANHLEPNQELIAADTTVAFGSAIIGKPHDASDARFILESLRGNCHQVHSAVCLRYQGQQASQNCQTAVHMRPYSPEDLNAYLDSGDWCDKAGGYAIQHPGFHPVERIVGCHANVMGLPLCNLQNLMEAAGLPGNPRIAQDCMAYLQIDCPVWQQIRQPMPEAQ